MASTFKIIQAAYTPPVKTIYINVKGEPNMIFINPVGDDGKFHHLASVITFSIEFSNSENQCIGTTFMIEYTNLNDTQQKMEITGSFGKKTIYGNAISITDLGCDGEYELPIYILNGSHSSDDTYDYIVRVVN